MAQEGRAMKSMSRANQQRRDQETGRYDYDGRMHRICICGCTLGVHCATNPHECFAHTMPKDHEDYKDCKCPKFRQSRKAVVNS